MSRALYVVVVGLLPSVAVLGYWRGRVHGRREGRAESHHNEMTLLASLDTALKGWAVAVERCQTLTQLLRATGARVVLPKDGAETRY